MDLKEYLNRIGFIGQYDKAELDNLFTIHKLHVTNIPFENLRIHSGEKNTMDLNIIYDKIVKSNQGGWCCKNNLLFSWVLKEIHHVSLQSVQLEQEFLPMDSHLIILIINLLCLINFESFDLRDQPQPPGVFRLINNSMKWVLEKTGRTQLVQDKAFASSSLIDKRLTKTLYSFTLTPRYADRFWETSDCLQTSLDSLFMLKSICSLQTPTVTFKDLVDTKEIPDCEIEAGRKDAISGRENSHSSSLYIHNKF
uniref:arylamine N-acetyltransferase n=1 Tax=Sinocyclocheilus grahami TaxID=75366 RepID=A0A672QTI9_SINGR